MIHKKIFYSILTFIISIGLFSSCSYSENQLSQKHTKSIMLKGNAVINVKPDTAILELNTLTKAKDVINIESKYNNIMNNIVDNIVKLGVDNKDIYVSKCNLGTIIDHDKISDYEIFSNILIKVRDINKIGEIITKANNEATKFGIDIDSGIEKFTVNDYDKYYKEALKKAIEDANNKAKSLGINSGSIVKIDEDKNYTSNNKNNDFINVNYGEKSNNIIEANELIKASVNITFEY